MEKKEVETLINWRKKNVPHVQWYYKIEYQLKKWRDSQKASKKQRDTIQKMLNCLMQMNIKIELQEPNNLNEYIENQEKALIKIEKEMKSTLTELYKERVKTQRLKIRIKELESRAAILQKEIEFHEEEKEQ